MIKEFKTAKGKTITYFYEGRNLKCKFKEGGELPECLTGEFTSPREAEIQILRYLDEKTPWHAKGSLQKRIKEAKVVENDD